MATDDPHDVVTLRGEGDVDFLLRRAIGQIEALGLEVLAVIDHSGEAAEVGVILPDSKLVLFGSAATADLILAHPRIALDLPLKLLISERDDGHVFISFTAPSLLAQRHGLTDDEAHELRVVETSHFSHRFTTIQPGKPGADLAPRRRSHPDARPLAHRRVDPGRFHCRPVGVVSWGFAGGLA